MIMANKKKIDPRVTEKVGAGALTAYPAFMTPWGKLIPFLDVYRYGQRFKVMLGAGYMQVLRILIPDYETRVQKMCDVERYVMPAILTPPFDKIMAENHCVHPFIKGGNIGGYFGDSGDENYYQPGRINDYGTYRLEKELDHCPAALIGSETCRCSVMTLQQIANVYGGTPMEYHMVEAITFGDLHCRIVAENRDKYPLPENKNKPEWDFIGPVVTSDQIKFTPEEKMLKEPQQFRPECDFKYVGATCEEYDAAAAFLNTKYESLNTNYVGNLLKVMVDNGELDYDYMKHIIKCVFEGCGKFAFGDFHAIDAIREWLGVPRDVNDGRVLGGLIELMLTSRVIKYDVVAFNKDEVIYDIKRSELLWYSTDISLPAIWYGMAKSLISARWFVWEETEGVPEDTLRIKIAIKRDTFC